MKSLEEDLGCSLFRRLGPQVKPTGAAVRLLPMVEELLVKMSSMKSELAALGGRFENLSFRLPSNLLGILRTNALSTFHECFPAADLEMVVRGSGEYASREKPVDFELDYLEHVPPEMVRRDLAVENFHAYVAPFHRLGQQSRISPTELRKNLLVSQDQWVFESMTQQLAGGGKIELRKWILPEPRMALDLAQQGQGIVFLPEWAAEDPTRERLLARLQIPGLKLRRTCCAWWEPSRPLTWVAEVFLSLLSENAGQDEAPD